jgi:hypothetical protein
LGKPYVGDLGLALGEQNVGKGPRFAGTPSYLSPEQASGEGQRLDGCSDVFRLEPVIDFSWQFLGVFAAFRTEKLVRGLGLMKTAFLSQKSQ